MMESHDLNQESGSDSMLNTYYLSKFLKPGIKDKKEVTNLKFGENCLQKVEAINGAYVVISRIGEIAALFGSPKAY